jgi:ubiquinone/menaquinone biosynthesis C-methylase UbiE
VSEPASRDHYSYTLYADPDVARKFDDRRFGGPIGELVAATQARVLANFVGRIQGRPILDVGTGTGRAALLMARGGATVTGVDASDEMLAIARQRAREQGLSVTFENGDAHKLPFRDRAFDVVISLRVIMHTPRWTDCVGELCRVADQLVILDYPSRRSVAWIQSIGRRMVAPVTRARTAPPRASPASRRRPAARSVRASLPRRW